MAQLFSQEVVFRLLGGLGLFLFGMKLLTDALQQVAGEKVRKTLSSLTSNRVAGALLGALTTSLLQASSATTIMVIGFVNAGLFSLLQGITVVLGANLGISLTSQLLALQIAPLALPAIAVGAGLKRFSSSSRLRIGGDLLLGFGILFLGLSFLKEAFVFIRAEESSQLALLAIGDSRLIWLLIGALLTMATQSGVITVGLAITMSFSGLLSLEAGIALVLGENIGSSITTNLAAIGAGLAARRTALAHFLFNAIGVSLVFCLFPLFVELVSSVSPGEANFVIQTQEQSAYFGNAIGDKPFVARHIANSHLLFNILNLLIFLPLTGVLAKATSRLLRGREVISEAPIKFIDRRVLDTPLIALSQARSEVRNMSQRAIQVLDETILYLQDADPRHLPHLIRQEEALDLLQREITDFLAALSRRTITAEASRSVGALMLVTNDLERIGDHCQNLWRLGQKCGERKIVFSPVAQTELRQISVATREFFAAVAAKTLSDDAAGVVDAAEREGEVERLEEVLRNNHISRLGTGECSVQPGLVFIDMLHYFAKIANHSYSIFAALDGDR